MKLRSRLVDNGKTRLINARLPVNIAEAVEILATIGGVTFSKALAEMVWRGVQHLTTYDELRFVRMETEIAKRRVEQMKRREVEIQANNAVVAEQDEKAQLYMAKVERDRARAALAKLEQQREAESALAGVPGMAAVAVAVADEDEG